MRKRIAGHGRPLIAALGVTHSLVIDSQRFKKTAIEVFERFGCNQVEVRESPEAFGSNYSVWEIAKNRVRIVWDGKDGWGYAQMEKDGDWENIEPIVRGSSELEDFANELSRILTTIQSGEE